MLFIGLSENFSVCDDQINCRICASNNSDRDIYDAFRENLVITLTETLVNTPAVIVTTWILMFSHSHFEKFLMNKFDSLKKFLSASSLSNSLSLARFKATLALLVVCMSSAFS